MDLSSDYIPVIDLVDIGHCDYSNLLVPNNVVEISTKLNSTENLIIGHCTSNEIHAQISIDDKGII